MDRFRFAFITILCLPVGAVCSSQDEISGSEVELRVRPGDNVTLYCDCRISTGENIVWYRKCSHNYQPPLVISSYKGTHESYENYFKKSFPRFTLFWNSSKNTRDLLIENVTESDLGLYYCGTVKNEVKIEQCVKNQLFYQYGNVTTQLLLDSSSSTSTTSTNSSSDVSSDCVLSWVLVMAYRFLFLILIPAAFFMGNIYGVNKEKMKLQERDRDQLFCKSVVN
ncbi:hypothetical protein DPEC_G00181280 [Dallia pectoralis]|uniref:Uncharacterized protein n=1 Tax=Dallia pectoralis TaxID=75939 RepID=A0ACC2GAC9_DALPE|nr:hypothetical protein DPEC_G00181280 [Dallia pectoralis]